MEPIERSALASGALRAALAGAAFLAIALPVSAPAAPGSRVCGRVHGTGFPLPAAREELVGSRWVERLELDGDGTLDLVQVVCNASEGLVPCRIERIHPAPERPFLEPLAALETDLELIRELGIRSGDVDGDGRIDLLAPTRVGGRRTWVTLLARAGGGYGISPFALSTGNDATGGFGDFDGDLRTEFVRYEGGRTHLHRYSAGDGWSLPASVPFENRPFTRAIVLDLDADGDDDYLAFGVAGWPGATVAFGDSAAPLEISRATWIPTGPLGSPVPMEFDGRPPRELLDRDLYGGHSPRIRVFS
jgi:hypothetical protein